MVTPVKVKARVVVDNSGTECEMPIIMTEQGVLLPLLDYLLSYRHLRSPSWMDKVVHAAYLLMQYMEANRDCFHDPKQLFQAFVPCLYSGTIGDDGSDPSGLYWLPRSRKSSNILINKITGLTDWLADTQDRTNMNPLKASDSYERRLRYAAWFRRTHENYLGHIRGGSVNKIHYTRHTSARPEIFTVQGDAVAFPERLFEPFFLNGIGNTTDRRVAVRNQLILLMMHYAGCRLSDALQLWVQDAHVDPLDDKSIILRLYHPEEGRAPHGWKSRNGTTTRAAYLREQWGLTPRNRLAGTGRVGWKTRVIDHRDHYIQLHWFPSGAGRIFARLWQEYLLYLAHVDCGHPYAFASFEACTQGAPLTINSFNDAYLKALYRIGEKPSKTEGRSPHAHRHAMGRRMERAGMPERVIQKVLHHKSVASQAPYTVPGIQRITEILNEGSAALQDPGLIDTGQAPEWSNLVEHGFRDIDPHGLYSGNNPIFKKGY